MPKRLALPGRVYRRLWPIVRMQWRTSRDPGVRLRIGIASVRLLSTDGLLAIANRLRGLATRPLPVYVNGLVHYVDLHANEVVPLFEIYDGAMYNRVPGFAAEPGQVVVDIGANIGAFSLWQAQRGARVYAFEPNPQSFARLNMAVAKNTLGQRVSAFNEAVGSTVGKGSLTVPDDNSTAGTIRADPHGSVQVTTLSALCEAHGLSHIDILKIDAEGSEVSILEAANTVLDHVRYLVLEYHSLPLEEGCRRILVAHGFAILERVIVDATAGAGVLYARSRETKL